MSDFVGGRSVRSPYLSLTRCKLYDDYGVEEDFQGTVWGLGDGSVVEMCEESEVSELSRGVIPYIVFNGESVRLKRPKRPNSPF